VLERFGAEFNASSSKFQIVCAGEREYEYTVLSLPGANCSLGRKAGKKSGEWRKIAGSRKVEAFTAMCNGTWVCFECRIGIRRRTWRLVTYMRPWLVGSRGTGRVRCPKCREICHFLGPSIEIPPKDDVAAWVVLRDQVAQFHHAAAEERIKERVRRKHDLEQRIRELESRPPNPGRNALVKKLRAQLAVGE
jgi:hypothetical protein